MRAIVNPSELSRNLRRLVDYAASDRPSRVRIANELLALSDRVKMATAGSYRQQLDALHSSFIDDVAKNLVDYLNDESGRWTLGSPIMDKPGTGYVRVYQHDDDEGHVGGHELDLRVSFDTDSVQVSVADQQRKVLFKHDVSSGAAGPGQLASVTSKGLKKLFRGS